MDDNQNSFVVGPWPGPERPRAVCGQSSAERVNARHGYRHMGFDTGAGSLGVAIPRLPAQAPIFMSAARVAGTGVEVNVA
ncbi:hypothetical protein GCM10007170_45740 [Arthrobacter liuii]|uniref:Uncharacterized protein n=1 Tax=Arthrobacter liuii TaxID=1476996 RepID=A0ABQ2AZH6_9MICC|nr:hypothetical protein GCM10007170_45740 [Arthrobacter liuii]